MARLIERTGAPVYLYPFEREVDAVVQTWRSTGSTGISCSATTSALHRTTCSIKKTSRSFGSISSYWTRFTATGNPNGAGTLSWPAFTHPNGRGRGGGSTSSLIGGPRGDRLRATQCDFWDGFFLDSVVGSLPAAHPLSDLCGATIDTHFRLDYDLACPGTDSSQAPTASEST